MVYLEVDGVVVMVGDVSGFDMEGVKGLPHDDATSPGLLQHVVIEWLVVLLPEVWESLLENLCEVGVYFRLIVFYFLHLVS